jgi:hypothetical protein
MDEPEQLADISYHDMLEAPVEAVPKPQLTPASHGCLEYPDAPN